MDDCFFVLLRSYTRIDHVLVRILDTRIFHKFGSNTIIRDFQHREATYAALKGKDFNPFDSQWSLSPTQSDEVYGYLEPKLKTKDLIVL
jgi:type 2A phosphatase activator TIP41